MASKISPIPEGYHSLTPYLVVNNGDRAVEFYQKAFNAEVVRRLDLDDGRVGHAELRIGDCIIMIADEMPDMGNRSPVSLHGSPVSLYFYTPNVDQTFARALSAGAKEKSPVGNKFYGDRVGTVTDPFGHEWCIATHVEDVSEDEMEVRAREAMKSQGGKSAAA